MDFNRPASLRSRAFFAHSLDSCLSGIAIGGGGTAAVDLPEANDLTVGIMALVAQQEREAISKRTKEALAVARSRGVELGNPNGAAALGGPARAERRSGRRSRATPTGMRRTSHRWSMTSRSRHTSLGAIASELNARGMLTRRGGRWHESTVMNLLDRLGLRETDCDAPVRTQHCLL